MVKLLSIVLRELRGPYVLLSKNTSLELGINRGDYIILSVNNKKTVAIVKDIVPRMATIIVSHEIARLLSIKEIDLIEVYKPVIEKASKIYVKVIEGEIDYLKLRNFLSGKVILNNSLINISFNGTRAKVNIIVELGDNDRLYLINYDTVIKILESRENMHTHIRNELNLNNEFNIPNNLLDSLRNAFISSGFMIEDCSSSNECPELIDLRAYKVIDDFIYEILVIYRFYNRVFNKEIIDKIMHSILKSKRLPNMVIMIVKDFDKRPISIARSRGILPIVIHGIDGEIEQIISSKINKIFDALTGKAIDNKGYSILTKIRNIYSGLKILVENRSMEA